MKKVKLLLCLLLLLAVGEVKSQPAGAQLGCDSTTYKKDTIKAQVMVYWDSVTKKIETSQEAYIVRTTCRLMYYGIQGAPNAQTNNVGVKESVIYIKPNKTIPEKFIITFIK